MVNDFSKVADFCVVYIEEAHPSDGWALEVTLISSSRKRENFKNYRKKKREKKKQRCHKHILNILALGGVSNAFCPAASETLLRM